MTDMLRQTILQRIPELELRRDQLLAEHCSFRIGGPADMAFPKTEAELTALLALLRETGEPFLLLGRGSNMLFADGGTRRLVIHPCGAFEDTRALPGDKIEAGSAVTLASLAVFARDNGLTGLEFAHGIPGSLGGAVFMNAGAYGGEMAQVVESVRFWDWESGKVCTLSVEALELGYRRSRFCGKNDIILSAVLRLRPGDRDAITEQMRALAERRRASQPLDKASAGSTFKRPAVGYAAAMIDECGLKGYSVGAAQVSEKHAGFVVNNGGASCAEVLALMDHVRAAVLREKGVALEAEVRIIRD